MIDIAPGVEISTTVMARAAIEATTGTPGVIRLQPGIATVAGGIGRRIGELLHGRPSAGPTDGVSVEFDENGEVAITLTMAIAGRQAAELALDMLDRIPGDIEELCGVRPVLSIRITELIPGLIAPGGPR